MGRTLANVTLPSGFPSLTVLLRRIANAENRPAPMVLNEPEMQQRVWDEISAKLESIQPGIMASV